MAKTSKAPNVPEVIQLLFVLCNSLQPLKLLRRNISIGSWSANVHVNNLHHEDSYVAIFYQDKNFAIKIL